MKPSEIFELHAERIREIVEANRGLNPRVFGSVLHGTDIETSDLDILIDAAPCFTLFDMARIALEIDRITKTTVDVVTAEDISPKYRAKVLAEARPL